MDPTNQWFTTLGVNSALAAILFYFYRKDVNNFTDQWKGQSEMLMKVVIDNTIAITKLTEILTRDNNA
jgi:hypothetical protein